MESGPFSDAKVVEQSAKFVCIRVDCDKDEKTADKYQIKSLPTVLFLKSSGEVLGPIKSREADKLAENMAEVAKDYKE
ncbi:MAG: thioredoxin family protein [Planctomycetes bacterium]|nr:thioredoxin family protein [Planctomycetota bacterium]